MPFSLILCKKTQFRQNVTYDGLALTPRLLRHLVASSVLNFDCPCARDNPKSRRTTKNSHVVVRRTTINVHVEVKLDPIYRLGQPKTWMENQKL